ncbi:hypothetical protein [Actinoplanes sp. L3-i22]|uniref:hypothetical protein n=1 Tax=Actinoplanes sp. L3-i22 TaxID=2836373 RepID=UPI001C774A64|nr:hypothetical protein [Actinoplanes sp. L3-i22]BCY07225.1 hypothetical protein L3i22_023130 [Actinoplanes sp. L3-i22]
MARFPARVFVLPVAAVLLATAACGDPGAAPAAAAEIQLVDGAAKVAGLTGDGRGAGSAAPSSAPAVSAETPNWVQLSTNQAPIGTTVTEVRGFTLYRFDKDKADPSTATCVDDCAVTWPPVLIKPGGRVFVDGIKEARIGAVRRPDGTVQVTLAGWPVYQFAGDKVPGELNGQGVGGTWFAVKPNGGKIDDLVVAATGKAADPDKTTLLAAKQTGSGAIVTDQDGATLYRNDKDCTGDCAAQWRPVVADAGSKLRVDGIDTDRVGTKKRDDGTVQLALDGSPLYRNAADKSTGTVIASAAERGWNPAR